MLVINVVYQKVLRKLGETCKSRIMVCLNNNNNNNNKWYISL